MVLTALLYIRDRLDTFGALAPRGFLGWWRIATKSMSPTTCNRSGARATMGTAYGRLAIDTVHCQKLICRWRDDQRLRDLVDVA